MLTHNAAQILQRMKSRQARVVAELSVAARTIGAELNAAAKKALQTEVYDVPIPLSAAAEKYLGAKAAIRTKTTKGKHGKWTRTGNLKRQENWRTEGPTVVLHNNANYALARNNLGTGAGRKIASAGVRSVQWEQKAVKEKRSRILEVRRKAIQRALQV